MQAFANAVRIGAFPQLTNLDLELNQIGDAGDAGIAAFVTAIGSGAYN